MAKYKIDLTGRKFNGIEVLGYSHCVKNKNSHGYTYYWICKCHCGNEFICNASAIRNETYQSCGCLKNSLISKKNKTHGMSHSRLFKVWSSMNNRCRPNGTYYKLGRKVCYEWSYDCENGFENFRDWALANGYDETKSSHDCSIDRINNDGDYEPSNCRWVDLYVQANNQKTTIRYSYKGENLTLSELSRKYNVSREMLSSRIHRRGMSIAEAIESPKKIALFTYNGETHSLYEWSKILGISKNTLKSRLYAGYSIEDILTKRIKHGEKVIK